MDLAEIPNLHSSPKILQEPLADIWKNRKNLILSHFLSQKIWQTVFHAWMSSLKL